VSPAVTFRISSALLGIAVIAVSLGVAHESLFLGIVLAVLVAPALLYTVVMAVKGRQRGRPLAVFEKVWTFLFAVSGVASILMSALVAFCMTCAPVGFVSLVFGSENAFYVAFYVAPVIGAIGAVVGAVLMARVLLTRTRRRA
jgi:hypothetical protein